MKRAREKRTKQNEELSAAATVIADQMEAIREIDAAIPADVARTFLHMAHSALSIAHTALHEELLGRARSERG